MQGASDAVKDPKLRSLMGKLSEYSNIPRKKKKFEVRMDNCILVVDSKNYYSSEKKIHISKQKKTT